MDNIMFNLARATWSLPDPGTGEAITIQRSGIIEITTGASGETNSLADPAKEGIMFGFVLLTDGGGDRVITAASAINQSSNTVITLGDAGDFIMLISVKYGATKGAYRWKVLANDGAALS